MIEKYGKKYGEIRKIKENFLTENEILLKEWDLRGKVYKKQPFRKYCKLCNSSLDTGNEKSFSSHGITYKICSQCQHVNGIYDDTPEFSEFVYCEQDYGLDYSEETRLEYQNRKELIYTPKVKFLKEILPENSSILEIGSGSGYFCSAADDEGFDVLGVEISEKQVDFADKMIGKSLVSCVPANEMVDVIRNTEREIIVAIGVLEHIYNLQEVLVAINENINIKYLYFSVPLFSLSVYLEMIFQNDFNRQLGGDHTHLFTHESINYMNEKFGFEVEGKWLFGTDIMDLWRFMMLELKRGGGGEVLDMFSEKFISCADSLQYIVDKSEFCSEVHMLVKVNH